MDKEEYVQAARAVRDANSPKASVGPRAALFMASPVGGGWRILEAVASTVRRTEVGLRELEPPAADRSDLEQHFLHPWSELAEYLDGLVSSTRRWLGPKAALRLLEDGPQDRQEDIDFCVAYGLDDPTEPGAAPVSEQPLA